MSDVTKQNASESLKRKRTKKNKLTGITTDADRYKGEFKKTCLAVYDALPIEKRAPQRQLLADMAEEMEAAYLKKTINEKHKMSGVEVAENLQHCKYFIGQAPVGTGKTYVLLLLAFISFWLYGKKTVISTQTKVLQNQILKKDIPNFKKMLKEISGTTGMVDEFYLTCWTAHLVKGRKNYLCPMKVKQFLEATQDGRDMVITGTDDSCTRISYHQLLTLNGDCDNVRTESLDLDRYSQTGNWNEEILDLISAAKENCSPDKCAYFPMRCPYYNAKYMDSPLIICNHNIVKTILRPDYTEEDTNSTANILSEPGNNENTAISQNVDNTTIFQELDNNPIVKADNLFFDEAHHFMGYYCGKRVKLELSHGIVHAKIFAPIFCTTYETSLPILKEIRKDRIQIWREWKNICKDGTELYETKEYEKELQLSKIAEKLNNLIELSISLKEKLITFSEKKAGISIYKLNELIETFAAIKTCIENSKPSDYINNYSQNNVDSIFVDIQNMQIFSSDKFEQVSYVPGEISSDINKQFNASFAGFISGTLMINNSADVFRAECGLPECRTLKVDSPFDHKNIILWVPKADAEVRIPGYSGSSNALVRADYDSERLKFIINFCLQRIPGYVQNNMGGVLILCTSNTNKTAIANSLRPVIESMSDRYVYEQGEMPRARLVNNFLNSTSPVLVATNSFREGFDAVGEKLTWVILDKLPYGNKSDADLDKRIGILLQNGKITNKFTHIRNLMVFDLIQAMGRLERSMRDWGTLTILDPRFYWLCNEGVHNPLKIFHKSFLNAAEKYFEDPGHSDAAYFWLRKGILDYIRNKKQIQSNDAQSIQHELPFYWDSLKNLRDNIPSQEEWLLIANEMKISAEREASLKKMFGSTSLPLTY